MHHSSVFILGRQPAIGRAEIESLFGSEHVEPLGSQAIATDIPLTDITFERIGSSTRVARPIATIKATNWQAIARFLSKELPGLLDYLPGEGKIKLGVSVIGMDVSTKQLLATGLSLKKICKQAGRSVRLVPNTESALSSAQVLHNQLTGDLGIEMLLIVDRDTVHLAQTTAVQNITAYAHRDQNRPKRDARVGMLPPKLAQTIVNLATGTTPAQSGHIVLDPFCGTGVVLQEALIMGYGAYGTDLEPRMIDYSKINLEWLATHGTHTDPALEVGDATEHTWEQPFTIVACETYLGRPLSNWPTPDTLQDIKSSCNTIIEKFLRNIGNQIPRGTRLCLAVPAWKSPTGTIQHLSLLDHLEKIGYNRVSFEYASAEEMVYYRTEQIVARELLIIVKN